MSSLRPGGKSAAAFRTISEVADELDVPQHVLRFWETKFAQVRPLKRGGGRRYYRPEDVDLLRQIRDLLYTEGYTIKGVQRLLRESARPVREPQPEDELSARQRRELQSLREELLALRDLLRSLKS
jgi:DNA-binding transcriptional MerR regulator